MYEVDEDKWHARLMAWGAFASDDGVRGLSRPGEPEFRLSYDEADAMRVDALLARVRDIWELGHVGTRKYYLCRWWDNSVPGYKVLAHAMWRHNKREWSALVNAIHYGDEGAAEYLIARTVQIMDALETGDLQY